MITKLKIYNYEEIIFKRVCAELDLTYSLDSNEVDGSNYNVNYKRVNDLFYLGSLMQIKYSIERDVLKEFQS